MKIVDTNRFIGKVIGTISERDSSRQITRLKKLCEVLSYGYGIDHPNFDAIGELSKEEVREILGRLQATLTNLAKGEVVMDTVSIAGLKQDPPTDVHIINAFSGTTSQAHSRLQIDQSTPLPDAIVQAVLFVIHFYKIVVANCPVCNKLYVKGAKSQIFCSTPCKQQNYRTRLSPQKARKQKMQKSQRYHDKKDQKGKQNVEGD